MSQKLCEYSRTDPFCRETKRPEKSIIFPAVLVCFARSPSKEFQKHYRNREIPFFNMSVNQEKYSNCFSGADNVCADEHRNRTKGEIVDNAFVT